jgi:RimJ/RimL family protein N-acetyltransferase
VTTVTLRETADDDLPILFTYQADPVAAAMAASPSRDREAFDAHWAKIRRDPDVLNRTIFVDGEVAGGIASFIVDTERDVGYWIGREHWGRGIASAALAAFLEVDPIRPLHARVAEHNAASRRVLEKCGFVFVGTEGPGEDGIVEQILRLDA